MCLAGMARPLSEGLGNPDQTSLAVLAGYMLRMEWGCPLAKMPNQAGGLYPKIFAYGFSSLGSVVGKREARGSMGQDL